MFALSLIYEIIAANNGLYKNTFRKTWHNQKNIRTFALLKKSKMRYMPSHIKTELRFSPIGDYTNRGACFTIH
jgi:hypothetical protein